MLANEKGNHNSQSVVVLLERCPQGKIALSKIGERFQLTRREGQALEFLAVGLDTKEVANCMQISTNTAKVYIRMIMAKMGVASRLAVLAKILALEVPRSDQMVKSTSKHQAPNGKLA